MNDKMKTDRELLECKCSFRTKMVGDGCSVCNTDYWNEILRQQKGDDDKEAAAAIGEGMK